MLNRIRFLTAGESHGPKLTVIVEGLPAGIPIDVAGPHGMSGDLARRQKGFGRSARMKIEQNRLGISAGVVAGQTTGGPVAIELMNDDYVRWQGDIKPMTIPRPGHADLVGAIKYGYGDLRLSLERASARETAA